MKAYEVIDAPDKWIQSAFARTKQGWGVSTRDKDAYCFCAVGAIYRAYYEDELCHEVVEKLEKVLNRYVPHWNDKPGRTWEEVYQVLKDNNI